ncbi:hypothetical protein ABE504_13840 [Paenibacillus oryzisoli]|uniref:hypothetical protein n=1 Tax=Paenibacillus oryzisoli TaxID=1850517 RepID=UPI003D26846D
MTLSMDKNLIEHIVREVIASLQARGSGVVEPKPCLLLVHDGSRATTEIDKIIAPLLAKWQVGIESYQAPDLVSSAEKDVRHAVLMDIDQDLLVRGAQGFTDSAPSKLLATLLRNGTPVTLVPAPSAAWILQSVDSDEGLPEPAKRYRAHIRTYKDQLITFGAKFAKLTELELQHEMGLHVNKRVLTQKDIQDSHVPTITVSRHTLITPLARDTAKDKGLTILIQEP